MDKIVVASGNKAKIKEIKEILGGIEVITMREAGYTDEIVEDGKTFLDNALIKARAVYEFTGIPALSDDSGLCVAALDGRPGIFSARYSGGNDEDNNNLLLKELDGKADRSAKYCCAVALVFGDGEYLSAYGETSGRILFEREGDHGFGYDPLFYSDELQKSFGTATEAEKNGVSHRARALKDLLKKLQAVGEI